MEESLIHEFMSYKIFNYREELEKEENKFFEWVKKSREILEKQLNEEQLKLVDDYKHSLCLKEEYINYHLEIKILNLAVKIGMQLQEAFDSERE